jgi:hypothetical protein
MSKDQKEFLKAVIVFSILFWGVYFIGTWLIPKLAYHVASHNSDFELVPEDLIYKMDESKL